jgi:hypothetical protein
MAVPGVQVSLADPLSDRGLGQSSSLATWPTVLPVLRISSTTSALYSGGKNRRGRGIGLPSRGPSPHLGVHQAGSTPNPSAEADLSSITQASTSPCLLCS